MTQLYNLPSFSLVLGKLNQSPEHLASAFDAISGVISA